MEESIEKVRQGKAWTAIYIGTNFTVDLFSHLCYSSDCPFPTQPVTNKTITGSAIHTHHDKSSELFHRHVYSSLRYI